MVLLNMPMTIVDFSSWSDNSNISNYIALQFIFLQVGSKKTENRFLAMILKRKEMDDDDDDSYALMANCDDLTLYSRCTCSFIVLFQQSQNQYSKYIPYHQRVTTLWFATCIAFKISHSAWNGEIKFVLFFATLTMIIRLWLLFL